MIWGLGVFWVSVPDHPASLGSLSAQSPADGPHNLAGKSASLIDPRALTETARVATTKGVMHGVAFSPDSRYAYISQESVGADPGLIDVIDLTPRQKVFTIPVPAPPTGIAVWRRPN